jgi:hypothetical protein
MITLNDDLFHVLFVTTPSRLATPRFNAFFSKGAPAELELQYILKRREPVSVRDASGHMGMGWGPVCSESEFEAGCERLISMFPSSAWINVDTELAGLDSILLARHEKLGLLLSGHDMSPERAKKALDTVPEGTPIILALENEAMLLAGPSLLIHRSLQGLAIGTSYLSESSKMYDQLGLDKYRSLMRGLAKRAAAMGCRPYTTSNYCTFEPSGVGDKNKDFVSEQVDFVSQYAGWGSLTRFYSHLEVAKKTRLARKEENTKDLL